MSSAQQPGPASGPDLTAALLQMQQMLASHQAAAPVQAAPMMMPAGMMQMAQPAPMMMPAGQMAMAAPQLQALLVRVTIPMPDGNELGAYLSFPAAGLQPQQVQMLGAQMAQAWGIRTYPPRQQQGGWGGGGGGGGGYRSNGGGNGYHNRGGGRGW